MYLTLARKVKEGACVLFLGPGAVMAKDKDGKYRPLTEMCARHLAEKHKLALTPEEEYSLPYVTSVLNIRGLSSDLPLQNDVEAYYKSMQDQWEPHPMLEQLFNLKFSIIINTTPDHLFVRMHVDDFRDHIADFYNINYDQNKPPSAFQFDFEKENRPVLIYNLFGSYTKTQSLVLTYRHQLTYTKKIVSEQKNDRLPDVLTNALRNYPYHLFLGFDFEDWNLRLLLDTLYKNELRRSVQPYAYPAADDQKLASRTKVFFNGEFSMQFPEVGMTEFVDKLKEQLAVLDSSAGSTTAEATKATAFIWHNEKADQAGFDLMVKNLRAINIKVISFADGVGMGDTMTWMKSTLDQCQIVMPLISVDFFDPAVNPALDYLDELIKRNNPRSKFLVMPVILRSAPLEGSISTIGTIRPTDRQPILEVGKPEESIKKIMEELQKYINRP
jgi:SIR2-like domain